MPDQGNALNAEQFRKFQEAARELGCGEDEAAFEDKLRRIAKVKPEAEADASKTEKKAK